MVCSCSHDGGWSWHHWASCAADCGPPKAWSSWDLAEWGDLSLPEILSSASCEWPPGWVVDKSHASDFGLGSMGTPNSKPASLKPSNMLCHLALHNCPGALRVPSASLN